MILVHQDMRLTQLYCLIIIGIFCGVKGKTISVDWTLAGVLNYTESTPLQTDLGDTLELSCQSVSNLFIQTDLIQYESCNASEGSGLFVFNGFCFSGGQLALSLTENSQDLMNTVNFENNRIYYFTSYSNGNLSTANNQSINYGGQCADGLKMVVLIGETENPTPPATEGIIPSSTNPNRSIDNTVIIIAVAIVGTVLLVILVVIIICVCCCCVKRKNKVDEQNKKKSGTETAPESLGGDSKDIEAGAEVCIPTGKHKTIKIRSRDDKDCIDKSEPQLTVYSQNAESKGNKNCRTADPANDTQKQPQRKPTLPTRLAPLPPTSKSGESQQSKNVSKGSNGPSKNRPTSKTGTGPPPKVSTGPPKYSANNVQPTKSGSGSPSSGSGQSKDCANITGPSKNSTSSKNSIRSTTKGGTESPRSGRGPSKNGTNTGLSKNGAATSKDSIRSTTKGGTESPRSGRGPSSSTGLSKNGVASFKDSTGITKGSTNVAVLSKDGGPLKGGRTGNADASYNAKNKSVNF